MAIQCDLLVLAELNPDVVVSCGPDAPRFGQVETVVPAAALTLGSSGAITAAAAAAQALSVALCAVVGDDPAGALCLSLLADLGVDTGPVQVRGEVATGLTAVLSRPDGDRALLTFPGAMPALRCADVPPALLGSVRHVHVSSFFLQLGLHAGLSDLLAAVRAAGATTSIDPGWDPADTWTPLGSVLAEVDYLLPNAAECRRIAESLFGADAGEEVLDAARSIAAVGPTVVVKLGAAGAAVVSVEDVVVLDPPDRLYSAGAPVALVDTTGAGDNFDAGFLAGILGGADPGDAAALGVACGSISVGGIGGTGRLATAAEAALVAAGVNRRHREVHPAGSR